MQSKHIVFYFSNYLTFTFVNFNIELNNFNIQANKSKKVKQNIILQTWMYKLTALNIWVIYLNIQVNTYGSKFKTV